MLGSVKHWVAAAVLAVVVATSVWAATAVNVSGTWRDIHPGDEEKDSGTLELVQHGEKITGTIGDANGPRYEILEGKITKQNEISFLIDIVTPDGVPLKGVHKGKLDGDTIKGTYVWVINDDGQEHRTDWLATRVN